MEVIPTTPKGWYEKIDQFLSQRRFVASVAKQHSSRTPVAFHTPTPTRNTPSQDPNAMDVDTNERPKKLTQEERDKCFKEGRCLCCRKKGHMASSCTTYSNLPPLPACPPKKVAVIETTASVEEIAEEDVDRVIGRLSTPQETYNQDL